MLNCVLFELKQCSGKNKKHSGNRETEEWETAQLNTILKNNLHNMKTKKAVTVMIGSLLIVILSAVTNNLAAQVTKDSTAMKLCCMNKDGKMMYQQDGKMTPMEKDMTMANGTKCTTGGECIMKDGTKMKMKDGDCIDMSGNMHKSESKMTNDSKTVAVYACPMHPEMRSDKAGKCSKCGMDLVEKK